MDINKLSKILMCWGLEKKEYELVYFLYNNFEIGIPNTYIYKMDQKTTFNSIKDFTENNHAISGNKNIWLQKILDLFPKSKWVKLPLWEGRWGYMYI